jgi:REP element-mobilizing transposase RayT
VFFEDRDHELYLSLLREYTGKYQVQILGYCLMTNHVHLIAVPADATGLAKAIGRVHNDYARWLPIRRRESGHLWQNRFFSCPLEDAYTWAALAYVERNPVRAGMVAHREEWAWSSARQDGLVRLAGVTGVVAKLDAGALAGCAPGSSHRGGLPSPIARGNPNGKTLRRRSIHRAVRAASGIEFAKTEARTEAKTARVMCGSISGLSMPCNEMDWGVTVFRIFPDLPSRIFPQYRVDAYLLCQHCVHRAGGSLSARRRTEVRRGTLKACATEYRHRALAH